MKMGIKIHAALAMYSFFAFSSINYYPAEALPTYSDQKGHNDDLKMLDLQVDCSNAEDGERYPSPSSCSEYYECDHGITFHFYCPIKHGKGGHQRLYFDEKLQVCNWPSEVDCEMNSNNASIAARIIDISIGSEKKDDTEPADDFDCSKTENGEKFPSPTNCSEFYVCVSNIAYLQICPMMMSGGRLYYDPEIGTCNWPDQVDCEVVSTSSPSTTTVVTDPSVSTPETSIQPESTTTMQIDSTTTEHITELTTSKSKTTTMEPTTSDDSDSTTLPDTPTQT